MATISSTSTLAKLVINKVPNQATYDNMVANNQINSNELYFVEGTRQDYLPLTGGTLTGAVTGTTFSGFLNGTAIEAYHAATAAQVMQAAAITTNNSYPLLLGTSTVTTAVTGTPNKSANLLFNPSINSLNIVHASGKDPKEVRITYGTTVDMGLGIGSANENHGLYDFKANKWMLYANASGTVTLNGNANTASTATWSINGAHATTAHFATTANKAASANFASTANFATTANKAASANFASTANYASTATEAAHATTAGSAAQLITGRYIQTNLGVSTSASFNGTANVSPGVTGTLAIGNGGTGATSTVGIRNNLAIGNAKMFYGTCGTATATTAKVVTCEDFQAADLVAGAIIFVKFTYTNSGAVGSLTLSVNGTDAKALKHLYNGGLSNIPDKGYLVGGQTYMFWYDGTNWVTLMDYNTNSNTIPSAYCGTAASTAAKTASCDYWVATEKSYLHFDIRYANTKNTALTMNVNSTGAKPIYINGVASSASNYTLPAGSYIAYYDGTNFYFRTDGYLTVGGISTFTTSYGDTLPVSGTEGQMFFQTSAEFYELPTGGSAGQALIKNSNSNRDVTWGDVGGIMSPTTTTKYYVSGSQYTIQNTSPALFNTSVYVENNVLFGAAWNDYAEFRVMREKNIIPYGYCVCENGDDTVSVSTERLQPAPGIVSDTYGYAIGKTDDALIPIAVSGRVLAYTYEDRNEFTPGDAVCAAPGGTVSKMTREEIKDYPDRIVGTVSAIPDYEEWGAGHVKVNNRIWIKVR